MDDWDFAGPPEYGTGIDPGTSRAAHGFTYHVRDGATGATIPVFVPGDTPQPEQVRATVEHALNAHHQALNVAPGLHNPAEHPHPAGLHRRGGHAAGAAGGGEPPATG